MKETWKDVINYEGIYMCSDLGRIKSIYKRKEKIIKQYPNTVGYLSVGLYKNGIHSTRTVHQIVCEVFLNHIPNKFKYVINHIDGNKLNNNLTNLEVVSHRDNTSICFKKNSNNFTSRYNGVYIYNNKFRTLIEFNKKKYHLGMFDDEKLAANIYQDALLKIDDGSFIEWYNILKSTRQPKTYEHNTGSKRKKIIQNSMNGEFIKIWNSIKDIKTELKIQNISECCKGKFKSAGGFKWVYYN